MGSRTVCADADARTSSRGYPRRPAIETWNPPTDWRHIASGESVRLVGLDIRAGAARSTESLGLKREGLLSGTEQQRRRAPVGPASSSHRALERLCPSAPFEWNKGWRRPAGSSPRSGRKCGMMRPEGYQANPDATHAPAEPCFGPLGSGAAWRGRMAGCRHLECRTIERTFRNG